MKKSRNLIAALIAVSFLAIAPAVFAADADKTVKTPVKATAVTKKACPDCKGKKLCPSCKAKMNDSKKACPDHKNMKPGEPCESKTPCADCKKQDNKKAQPKKEK